MELQPIEVLILKFYYLGIKGSRPLLYRGVRGMACKPVTELALSTVRFHICPPSRLYSKVQNRRTSVYVPASSPFIFSVRSDRSFYISTSCTKATTSGEHCYRIWLPVKKLQNYHPYRSHFLMKAHKSIQSQCCLGLYRKNKWDDESKVKDLFFMFFVLEGHVKSSPR